MTEQKKKSFNSKIKLDNLLISTTRFLKDEIVDLSFFAIFFFFLFFFLVWVNMENKVVANFFY